jgi:hypothetical protein
MNSQKLIYRPDAVGCGYATNHFDNDCAIEASSDRGNRTQTSNSATTTRRSTLFLFIDRWTSSRSWKLTISLARYSRYLADKDITVIMVGQETYLHQARKLAASLQIPFKLISESHDQIKRLSGIIQKDRSSDNSSIFLVDSRGCPLYWHDFCGLTLNQKLASIKVAVYLSNTTRQHDNQNLIQMIEMT